MTILSTASAGDLTDNGIGVQDSIFVDFELLIQNNQDLLLTIAAIRQFQAIAGLNRNQTAIAQNIEAIQGAGNLGAFTPVIASLLLLPDLPSLARSRLSPTYRDGVQIRLLTLCVVWSCVAKECRAGDKFATNFGNPTAD